MKKMIGFAVISILLLSCSPSVTRIGYNEGDNSISNCNVIIKENAEIDESIGKVIGNIEVGDTGFSTNCSEKDVMLILKQEACSIGADMINLTEIKRPDLMSSCFRVSATFIKLNESIAKDKIETSKEYSSEKIDKRDKEDSQKKTIYIITSIVVGVLVGWLIAN